MSTKDKVFILGVLFFVIIGLIVNYSDDRNCGQIRKQVDEGFSKLKSPNSLVHVIVREDRYKVSIKRLDSVIISNPNTIEDIRRVTPEWSYLPWRKSPTLWSLKLEFLLRDGTNFSFYLKGENNNECRVYRYGECQDDLAIGNKALGKIILESIESQDLARHWLNQNQ